MPLTPVAHSPPKRRSPKLPPTFGIDLQVPSTVTTRRGGAPEREKNVASPSPGLEGKMDLLLEKQELLSSEFKKMTLLVESYKASLDFTVSKVHDFENDLDALKTENCFLKKTMSSLLGRIEELEQRSRITNLEITGLPETPGENAMALAVQTVKAIGVTNAESIVKVAHRVPTKSKSGIKPLIVQFDFRSSKTLVLETFKKKRKEEGSAGVKASTIHPSFPNNKVFFNEHLAPHNRKLLNSVKDFAKSRGFRYVWVQDCKIFMKKEDGCKSYMIKNVESLETIPRN